MRNDKKIIFFLLNFVARETEPRVPKNLTFYESNYLKYDVTYVKNNLINISVFDI